MYAALSKQSINTDSVGKNNNHVDKKYKRTSTFQSSHATKLVSAQCDAIIGLDSTNIDTDDENRFLGSKVRHDAITTRRESRRYSTIDQDRTKAIHCNQLGNTK